MLVQRGISLKPLRAGVLLFPLPLRFMFIQRNLHAFDQDYPSKRGARAGCVELAKRDMELVKDIRHAVHGGLNDRLSPSGLSSWISV